MWDRILNSSLLVCIAVVTLANNNPHKDTIYVSDEMNTYLIFKKDINLVDLGSKNFSSKVDNNAVFIRTKRRDAGYSTLLVRYGEEYYFAYLKYKKSPQNVYHDFRDRVVKKEKNYKITSKERQSLVNKSAQETEEENNTSPEKTFKLEDTSGLGKDFNYDRLYRNAKATKNIKNRFKTIAVKQDNLAISCTNIKNDDTHTYLKLIFDNMSGLDYTIDFTEFRHVEVYNKGLFKKKKRKKEKIYPVLTSNLQLIPSYKSKVLVYVLPAYAADVSSGELKITFREKNGSRTIPLSIDAKEISKASVFK